MYFRRLESSAKNMAAHVANLKLAATDRLKALSAQETVRRAECKPNRKQAKLLGCKLAGYERIMNDNDIKNKLAYNKPGSHK